MPHPPPTQDQLLSLLYEELSPEDAALTRAQLDANPHAQRAWQSLQRTRQTLRGAFTSDAPSPKLSASARAVILTAAARAAAQRRGVASPSAASTTRPVVSHWRRPALALAAGVLLTAGAILFFPSLSERGAPSPSLNPSDQGSAPTIVAHAPEGADPAPHLGADALRQPLEASPTAPATSPSSTSSSSTLSLAAQTLSPPADVPSEPAPNSLALNTTSPSPDPNPAPDLAPDPAPDPAPNSLALNTYRPKSTKRPPSVEPQPASRPDKTPQQATQQPQQALDPNPLQIAPEYLSNSSQYQVYPAIDDSNDPAAPRATDTDDRSPQSLIARAESSMSDQRLDAAIEFLTQAIEHASDGPTEHRARLQRARAFQQLGQHPNAIEDLQVILQSNPAEAIRRQAELAFATSLIATGRPQNARAYLTPLSEGEDVISDTARDQLRALDEQSPTKPTTQQRQNIGKSPQRSNSNSDKAYPAPKSPAIDSSVH
jgi:tetratricopeptide (TPR) repeat protein